MEELGKINLFTSEFIIGTEFPQDKDLWDVETLQNWLNIKDKYYGRSNYSLEITQNITFFHIIELTEFKEILNDLIIIYKKSYPYGEIIDFIQYTFGYTLFVLEKFISIHKIYFIPYSSSPNIENDIYSCDEFFKGKIVDFILEPEKDIDWYKQYYKKIIELINDFDFDGIVVESNLIPPQSTETDKIKVLETQTTETTNEPGTPNFKNNFDKIIPVEIYKHFKAGLVDKQYLTENELNEYLQAAFDLKAIPKTKFKIKNAKTKQLVAHVFYQYYKNIAGSPHRKQKEYAALLGEYFEGYNTKNVSSNFNK